MAGLLSSERYQRVLTDIKKRRERQRDEDLRSLMSCDWGRRVVHWLLYDEGKLQSQSFNPFIEGIKDGLCAAMHMAKIEGARDLAMNLNNRIQIAAPIDSDLMRSESMSNARDDLQLEEQAAHDVAGELS